MPQTSLQKALAASRLAAQQAYAVGRASLARCEAAIEGTRTDLSTIIVDLKKMDSEAAEAVDALEAQLLEVGEKLEADFKTQIATFESFHEELERFSLTLFGRTMTGKSTLMEILTEGDGASIGTGAQRTTRDIRTYHWKNLEITDVPGIAAFEGDVDEAVAYEAARRADVILFLITDDAPQPVEAEHLARVIALGKPVIGLLNIKMALERERDFRRFEKRREKLFEEARIQNIVAQFRAMLGEHIEAPEVDFYPVHLRARFLADTPDYRTHREALGELSGFQAFEDRLLQEVVERGPMIRTRTLGDAAVVPLLEMTHLLFNFSHNNARIFELFCDKLDQVQSWRPKHRVSSQARLAEAVKRRVDALRVQVPGFVEEFLEDKKIDKKWKKRLKQAGLKGAVERAQKEVATHSKTQLEEFGKELEREIVIVSREFESLELDATHIIDTRRIASWAIIGVSLGVALVSVFAVAAAPMLVGTGFALAVGGSEILFRLFTKTREEKLKKHRAALTEQLSKHLDAIERDTLGALEKWYTQNIDAEFIVPFTSSLRTIASTLERLSLAQRTLARNLLGEVQQVNFQIVKRALHELDRPVENLSAQDIARVPGLETVMIMRPENHTLLEAQVELEQMLDTPLRLVIDNDDPGSVIRQVIGQDCEQVDAIDVDAHRVEIRCRSRSGKTAVRVNLAEQLTGLQIISRDSD